MPFKLGPGASWRIRAFDENGSPHVVVLKGPVARRCRFLRMKYIGGFDPDGPPERLCAMFQDPKTNEVYGQPVTEDP